MLNEPPCPASYQRGKLGGEHLLVCSLVQKDADSPEHNNSSSEDIAAAIKCNKASARCHHRPDLTKSDVDSPWQPMTASSTWCENANPQTEQPLMGIIRHLFQAVIASTPNGQTAALEVYGQIASILAAKRRSSSLEPNSRLWWTRLCWRASSPEHLTRRSISTSSSRFTLRRFNSNCRIRRVLDFGCGGRIARRLVKRKARSRATLAKPC